MIKEIKYLFYIFSIFIFIFYSGKYYFSDKNIKKSNMSILNLEKNLENYKDKLILLENDTENIIQYLQNDLQKKKKKYSFWKLLDNND